MAEERKLGAGVLAAAGRQGFKELGAALGRMSPDSISVDEPGGMFSPTQGEIAEANREGVLDSRLGEVRDRAEAARSVPEKGMERE